ncbi:MAG: cyclase family protein [Bacteroidetes bacterium]|nr:MAG: cyclase family protein [Bacteroidota bacterium]
MQSVFHFQNQNYTFYANKPLDISVPLREGKRNVNCYYAEPPIFATIVIDKWEGSVKKGASVNYQKLTITPHGNGTHTECYGHISEDENATINQCLQHFLFFAQVISVRPNKEGEDEIIKLADVKKKIQINTPEALIIRTLPNDTSKKEMQYSGQNPPYLENGTGSFLRKIGVKHLLVDLPSVDKEQDNGVLNNHKGFWNFPADIRKNSTITELIFVENNIPDGIYLLNLQIVSLEIDASPSKPILYALN